MCVKFDEIQLKEQSLGSAIHGKNSLSRWGKHGIRIVRQRVTSTCTHLVGCNFFTLFIYKVWDTSQENCVMHI